MGGPQAHAKLESFASKWSFKLRKSNRTIGRNLLHLSLPGSDSAQRYDDDAPPLRSELFSADQMQQHGKTLAGSHKREPWSALPDRLLARLAENEGVLLGVRDLLTEAVKTNRRITPAGEWLLDNFYLIEEQIRTAKRHLPKALQPGTATLAERPFGRSSARV